MSKVIAADFMPKDERSVRILRERSEQIAKHEMGRTDGHDGMTYVRFRLGENEYYGIHYHAIKEIMGFVPLTKLPSVPDFISGITNRRGALLAVLDLKKFFNFPNISYDENSYILVVKSQAGITVGILVDGIEGSDSYDPSTLDQPLLSVDAIKSDFLIGLHKGVTSIINIEAVMADSRLVRMMK